MRIIDVSVTVHPGMHVYAGDPPVRIERVSSLEQGALANVSRLDFGAHTGTHIDAPAHFIDGASGADALDLDALLGPAFVIDATAATTDIDAAFLSALPIPSGTERLIFKTQNSRLWERAAFASDFIGVRADAAEELVRRGVGLVGIDYLSIAPKSDPAPTHRTLLAAGVVILEGLNLRSVEAGPYDLVCLPLRIAGADGAPARAVLIER